MGVDERTGTARCEGRQAISRLYECSAVGGHMFAGTKIRDRIMVPQLAPRATDLLLRAGRYTDSRDSKVRKIFRHRDQNEAEEKRNQQLIRHALASPSFPEVLRAVTNAVTRGYPVTPSQWATSPRPAHLGNRSSATRRSRWASSIPDNVTAAVREDLKASIDAHRCLIARWSCSTMLLR